MGYGIEMYSLSPAFMLGYGITGIEFGFGSMRCIPFWGTGSDMVLGGGSGNHWANSVHTSSIVVASSFIMVSLFVLYSVIS
jgi:hypothetical protein